MEHRERLDSPRRCASTRPRRLGFPVSATGTWTPLGEWRCAHLDGALDASYIPVCTNKNRFTTISGRIIMRNPKYTEHEQHVIWYFWCGKNIKREARSTIHRERLVLMEHLTLRFLHEPNTPLYRNKLIRHKGNTKFPRYSFVREMVSDGPKPKSLAGGHKNTLKMRKAAFSM